MNKLLELFKQHKSKDYDDYMFWHYVCQTGFWTKRNHAEKHLTIFVPETSRSLKKQKPFLSIYDWFFNFLFLPIIGIHFGFLLQFLSYRKMLKLQVKAFKPKKITIIGYSQGGANSLLAGLYLKLKGYNVEGYSYGAPRILGLFWFIVATFTRLNWTRVVNEGDIVTKFPFALFGFKHYGKKVQLGKWWKISTKAHYPSSYIVSLQQL